MGPAGHGRPADARKWLPARSEWMYDAHGTHRIQDAGPPVVFGSKTPLGTRSTNRVGAIRLSAREYRMRPGLQSSTKQLTSVGLAPWTSIYQGADNVSRSGPNTCGEVRYQLPLPLVSTTSWLALQAPKSK